VLETALDQEMTGHLGHDKHGPVTSETGNVRNGTRPKTVLTEGSGQVPVEVPRDRAGTSGPQIVKKRQRRLTGVDEMVLSLYAKGLTTGEISAHFAEIYGASVSKETISRITGKVLEEMADWCNRPLDERRFLGVVANLGCCWQLPSSHELGWGAVGEAEAGPVVEFGGDAVEFAAGIAVEVGAFGQVLAQQSVGVLVGAALPG
jgi:Transposase, Mutator family